MDPPETRIVQNGLSISRITPKREISESEKQKKVLEGTIKDQTKEMRERPVI